MGRRQTFHGKLLAAINWRQRQSFFGGKLFLAAKCTVPQLPARRRLSKVEISLCTMCEKQFIQAFIFFYSD